jgi:hypothetical protein
VLHAIRSTYWYVGNRNLVSSWVLMYFLLPVVGAVLAPLFYLVVRGGLLVVQAETDGYIGFVAIAGLTGLFSQQATLKLKKIAEQFFSRAPSGSDATPQGGASASTPPPPSIASILPARPTASPNPQPVTLAGSGFAPPLTVTVTSPAGQATTIAPGKVRNATPTSLDMDLTLDPPGDWTLTVANGDGRVSPAFTLTVI